MYTMIYLWSKGANTLRVRCLGIETAMTVEVEMTWASTLLPILKENELLKYQQEMTEPSLLVIIFRSLIPNSFQKKKNEHHTLVGPKYTDLWVMITVSLVLLKVLYVLI